MKYTYVLYLQYGGDILSQCYYDQLTFAGPMVRISPNEVAFATSRIIHNVKDGSPKGDSYVKIAAFLIERKPRWHVQHARPKAP